jgi:succinate dehydrogenase / fumarate reductase iron-sulfur subunit
MQGKTAAPPDVERLQPIADHQEVDRPSACILCACFSTSYPSYWWNSDCYLGRAALLATYRWIVDSRDHAKGERRDAIEDSFRLYRCHTIMNCTEACPKDLNPAKALRHEATALGAQLVMRSSKGELKECRIPKRYRHWSISVRTQRCRTEGRIAGAAVAY